MPGRDRTCHSGLQSVGAGSGGIRGPVVELVVAVQILADGDIEGRAGVGDQHGAEGDAEGRLQIAAEQEAVAHIEVGAAVVGAGVGLVGREVAGAGCIGIREVEHVEAEQRNALGADSVVQHELVLVVHAAGLVLIDVFVDAVRARAGAGGGIVGGRA